MKLPRRNFLHLAAGAAALPMASRIARAQAYPTRPVRVLVGYSAGSASDIVARLIAQWLSERLGQQFVVENRPGAGGNIAAEAVVRSAPDGYTLLLPASPDAINATLYQKLNFNFIRDTAPVAGIVHVPNVMVVHPSFPAKTVPEFIAYAKANPGKISMATAGNGSTSHIFGELFKMMARVNLVAVPYRGGGPALIDMISGQVDVIFVPTAASIEYVRAGRLRAGHQASHPAARTRAALPGIHPRGQGATHRTRGRDGQAASGHARDRGRAQPRCDAVKVASDARSLPKGLTCTPAARQPAHMHGGCNVKRIMISVFRWFHSIAYPPTYRRFVAGAVTHVRSRRGHINGRLVTIWQ
jgi:tripartite-type tricarboxylate transporter receptor subunit TctC